ncbi:hypothetical protein [Rhodanobacter sp. L36]|uniref:hypothetical protein n=1 Tax=Rhodanobacter sp. L36 TaxID=1747221 RepID=UPI00131C15F0|nr:hypothetical protein [Rhodanobacter sp. L36]
MKWISTSALQREFGLTRVQATGVITEQTKQMSLGWHWRNALLFCVAMLGFYWMIIGAKSMVTSTHGWRLLLLELPGWLIYCCALFVWPRLAAAHAIRTAAAALASERAGGANAP